MVYTSNLKVVQLIGIGVQVENEVLGTGDGVILAYDILNGDIVSESYSASYGDVGSSTLTLLTETTHYTLAKDSGILTLTTVGRTLINTKILYVSYTHSPKASDTVLTTILSSVDKSVDRKTGNYWGTVKTSTEYFSGRASFTYPTTDQPFATDWDEPDYVNLKYRGSVNVSTASFITKGSQTATYKYLNNWDLDVDPDTGKIIFLNHRLPNGTRNIEIIYTHGYTIVDPQIEILASIIGGLLVFANITGGSYDDVTGYSLGRKQVQIGEVYVNVREVVKQLQERMESILDDVGRKANVFSI
jgi:hypothetical protein